jgi:tRNA A-37 threonylcarbamoyl transferase component Bud32
VQLQRVAGYQLEKLLGEGGQGSCYRAREQVTGRQVAIKIIEWDPHSITAERQRQRIEREVQYLRGRRIPGVVRLLDSGEVPQSHAFPRGAAFLVYQLIGDGSTLRDRLQGVPAPSICDVVEACVSLGSSLGRLARRGIFHRDIKPQNIAFRGPDSWGSILIDFGVARALDARSITSTGKMWGTPFYSPPEWLMAPLGWPGDASPNPDAWDCYSYARTAAVSLAVALGRPLSDTEWLANKELLTFLRRHLPNTVQALMLEGGLKKRPGERPKIKEFADEHFELEVAAALTDDLGTLAAVKHLETVRSVVEARLQRPLRATTRYDEYGDVATSFMPRGGRGTPHLILGTSLCLGAPCLSLTGNAMAGREARRRDVPEHFTKWARKHRNDFVACDVGLKRRDRIEKVIARVLNWTRRHPSERMVISWELPFTERARVYENLCCGKVKELEPLLELWKLLIDGDQAPGTQANRGRDHSS